MVQETLCSTRSLVSPTHTESHLLLREKETNLHFHTAFYKAPAFNDQSETSLNALTTNLDSFNSKLATKLADFKSSNTGVTAQAFNTSSYFWEVFNDPTSFGLDSDITAANADGTSAVWYDNYHPGQAIHKLVAQGFVAALADFF